MTTPAAASVLRRALLYGKTNLTHPRETSINDINDINETDRGT